MSATRQTVYGRRSVLVHEEIQRVVADDGAPLALVHKQRAELGEYSPHSARLEGVNLLCLHGLGQNRLTFDLPSISPANYFAEMGLEVWIADLRGHGLSRELGAPLPKSFDEYVSLDVPALIRHINMNNDRPLLLLGHSLGGTILYALAPEHCTGLAGMISVAGPYHFGKGLRLLRLASLMLHRTYGVNPLRLLAEDTALGIDLVGEALSLGKFYFDAPLLPALYRVWLPGSMDRETLKQRLERGFDRTSLAVMRRMVVWASTGRLLDDDNKLTYEERFAAKRTPLFFVQGSADSAVPLTSVQPAYDAYTGPRTLRVFGQGPGEPQFGHIDLLIGQAAPEHTWPAMLEWMARTVGSEK